MSVDKSEFARICKLEDVEDVEPEPARSAQAQADSATYQNGEGEGLPPSQQSYHGAWIGEAHGVLPPTPEAAIGCCGQ